jgi:glycolate oxidase
VILPGSGDQVSAVIKICNRYGLRFKASSTGWGFMCDPDGPGALKLDLRRMNRVLEINETDMYVVLEPYVTGAQLQAELMKRSLYCNITGAGAQCSALPLAAHENIGHLGQVTSMGDRNLLGVEWVTPEGDVINIGSYNSTGEWFCGDGPGPSMRGVNRGSITPQGGLGVYTKAAMKLYHWAGPGHMELEGVSPHYKPRKMPERFSAKYLTFPTVEDRLEASRKFGESEILFVIMGFAPSMVSANIATSNPEDIKLSEQIKKEAVGPGAFIIISGYSDADFAYKEKVLGHIVRDTNGKFMSILEDEDIAAAMMWRCTRITASLRETLRANGAFGGVVGGTDAEAMLVEFVDRCLPLKQRLIDEGLVFNDGAETFATSMEHGHYGHTELLIRYNEFHPGTAEAMGKFMGETTMISLNNKLGVPHQVSGTELHAMFGAVSGNYDRWMKEIKRKYDPNEASISNLYISGK